MRLSWNRPQMMSSGMTDEMAKLAKLCWWQFLLGISSILVVGQNTCLCLDHVSGQGRICCLRLQQFRRPSSVDAAYAKLFPPRLETGPRLLFTKCFLTTHSGRVAMPGKSSEDTNLHPRSLPSLMKVSPVQQASQVVVLSSSLRFQAEKADQGQVECKRNGSLIDLALQTLDDSLICSTVIVSLYNKPLPTLLFCHPHIVLATPLGWLSFSR